MKEITKEYLIELLDNTREINTYSILEYSQYVSINKILNLLKVVKFLNNIHFKYNIIYKINKIIDLNSDKSTNNIKLEVHLNINSQDYLLTLEECNPSYPVYEITLYKGKEPNWNNKILNIETIDSDLDYIHSIKNVLFMDNCNIGFFNWLYSIKRQIEETINKIN